MKGAGHFIRRMVLASDGLRNGAEPGHEAVQPQQRAAPGGRPTSLHGTVPRQESSHGSSSRKHCSFHSTLNRPPTGRELIDWSGEKPHSPRHDGPDYTPSPAYNPKVIQHVACVNQSSLGEGWKAEGDRHFFRPSKGRKLCLSPACERSRFPWQLPSIEPPYLFDDVFDFFLASTDGRAK